MITFIKHHQIDLAIHEVRGGTGRALLLLHGLGDQTHPQVPAAVTTWTGPIVGLDFTGHGSSTVPPGGGYSAEILMADVDTALAHLGPCTLVGFGLGAYVATLIAGGRPKLVRGAILADGPGITGGPAGPPSGLIVEQVNRAGLAPDPWAMVDLSRDPRPPDYAISYVRQAAMSSGLDHPLAVVARTRPPWLQAVADDPAVLDTSMERALAAYAAIA